MSNGKTSLRGELTTRTAPSKRDRLRATFADIALVLGLLAVLIGFASAVFGTWHAHAGQRVVAVATSLLPFGSALEREVVTAPSPAVDTAAMVATAILESDGAAWQLRPTFSVAGLADEWHLVGTISDHSKKHPGSVATHQPPAPAASAMVSDHVAAGHSAAAGGSRNAIGLFGEICANAISDILANVSAAAALVELKTVFVLMHLIGVVLGLGAVTFLDVFLIRAYLKGFLPHDARETLRQGGRAAQAGLALLWASGIAFLAIYQFDAPETVYNPKIWAKVTIVGVLTLNGWLIHALLLRRIEQNAGKPLFHGMAASERLAMTASGVVSALSWYTAFALGALREFNFAVDGSTILIGYAALLLVAVVTTQAMFAVRRMAAPSG